MTEYGLAMAADQKMQSAQCRKPTWRDLFVARMEQILRLAERCSVGEPHCPKAGNGHRPVMGQ
jgi:IS5 family transposase